MFWLRVNMKRIWNRIKECLKDESGIGVVEIILILVENLALYIEYIEGGKYPKNKLYTRYTQEKGQVKLSKKEVMI